MNMKQMVLSTTAALALMAVSTKVANADTVTVKAGDTVSAIAADHHTTVSAIEQANHLSNANLIFVGDHLEVNGSTTTTTTPAVASPASTTTTSQATKPVASQASTTTTSQAAKPVASQASTTTASQVAKPVASQASTAVTNQASTQPAKTTYKPAPQATTSQATVTSNNGAGTQSQVLSQMASRTGVSAATWNRIITRESNWQSSVKNSTSGAYGLFQNMHISSGSVQDQVNAAVNLYHAQGMSAWGE